VVAANAVIDHLRARRPSVSLESLEEAGTELPDSSASPEEVFARQELEQAVERLFAQLGDEDTLFVELHYARGLPHERVAELMGCSVGAVYARKSRIRKRLSELAQGLHA
jgi:RNA polymerase sigma factor (sigma-70 family)